ncbi:hypothetical protein [Streptomyces sp. NPDC058398]|uniref:hypothetical protein n=1 Tax=Streptomyces sp. NPDC058398 TaxID=3346479 RepID=UPI00364E6DD2
MHQAKTLDGALPDVVSEELALPGSAWGVVAGPLISAVHEARHLLWLTGGFARDVIAGCAAEVNDLDLTGTAPPGRFTELARKVRRRSGLEFRTKVSPHSLVCSAQPPLGDERLYEYRTLNSAKFGFQACGSDLEVDAGCRDFTVNSLYYDPVEDVVIDPTGQGLADLRARPRRLASLKATENPLDQARIVLRAVKFAVRWEETTGYELCGTALSLARTPTTWDGLAAKEWELLSGDHHRGMHGCDVGRQMRVATALGPGAAELFATLLEVRL